PVSGQGRAARSSTKLTASLWPPGAAQIIQDISGWIRLPEVESRMDAVALAYGQRPVYHPRSLPNSGTRLFQLLHRKPHDGRSLNAGVARRRLATSLRLADMSSL